VVSQRHLMAVVTFLIGCAFLVLMVGCAGTSSDTSEKKEQGSSPQATQSEEEARCEGTRKTNVNMPVRYTTNDLPGCPKGGLLLGTDKTDELAGEKGDDEIRGLGGSNDTLWGEMATTSSTAGRATRGQLALMAMTSFTAGRVTKGISSATGAMTSSTVGLATIHGWT
jgi:hypothetical protein